MFQVQATLFRTANANNPSQSIMDVILELSLHGCLNLSDNQVKPMVSRIAFPHCLHYGLIPCMNVKLKEDYCAVLWRGIVKLKYEQVAEVT